MGFVSFPATAEIAAHNTLDTGVHGVGSRKVGYTIINSDTYTGNDANNRAIAHGLGTIPHCVIVYDGNSVIYHIFASNSSKIHQNTGVVSLKNCNAADATNFYTGTADVTLNSTGRSYYWVAIG